MLNMFRTLIHPSSGAWDFSIVSPHWSCVLVSMCVGVSVWLGLGGIRVAGWSTNAQVCLDRISLSFWYLSCDKKLTHRTFVRAIQNHVSSILAKSLIISFQYNIETVYFFYSNPVYMHIYIYTGCFKKSFTNLKAYRNLYRGHTQRFELSKCSKTHRVLPRDSYG